jgi:hypothetical protein
MTGRAVVDERRNTMKHNNRVLGRMGARELTPREVEHVTGAVHTETVCTVDLKGGNTALDGDRGECGF